MKEIRCFLCALDYSSICRIEGGQKDSHILTLKNIADKLNVDAKDFLDIVV